MLLWFCNSLPGYSRAIDSIMTKEDLNRFMVTRVDTSLSRVKLQPETSRDTGKYSTNSFYKLDINNDGLTDLVISSAKGVLFFAILDNGNNTFSIVSLSSFWKYDVNYSTPFRQPLINILRRGNSTILVTQEQHWDSDTLYGRGRTDSLICIKGEWAEYSAHPDTLQIAHIKIDVDDLFLDEIHVDLDSSGKLMYNYSADRPNRFGKMSKTGFAKISAAINYLGFSHYRSHFQKSCDDCGSLTMVVTYANGNVKTIKDHGMAGTFGLEHLYPYIFRTCENALR